MSEDILDIPDTGAIFTFGRSRFADNTPSHFFVRKDPIIDLSCGDEHTVVVCKKGRVFSFGRNAFGELGLGSRTAVARPNCIKTLKPLKIVHVASGRGHTLFLTDGGQVYSCGNNDEGQLGHGDNMDLDLPEKIKLDQNVKQLSAGFKHSAALTGEGKVYVWGDNREGQLGLGEDIPNVNIPTLLNIDFTVVQISCGYYHTLLLSDEGKVYAFGEGEYGKLGFGDDNNCHYPKCIEINSVASFISAGGNHSSLLTRDGKLYLWGNNDHGQLGLKEVSNSSVPTALQFDQIIIFVSLGENHSAIITENGELYTFGDNRHGKLAIEKSDDPIQMTHEPLKVQKFKTFIVTKVSCGGCHTMVLALPKMSNFKSGSTERCKNWEIYDVSSSTTSSSKTTLPPLHKLSRTASSSSPVLTPPSPSLHNTVIHKDGKEQSTPSTLSLTDNFPCAYQYSDEISEKEANREQNGNYFETEPETPIRMRSVSCQNIPVKDKKSLTFNDITLQRSLKCSPPKSDNFKSKHFSNSGTCESSDSFEIWFKKHKEEMNFLAGQICSASHNLKQVMKKFEGYFNQPNHSDKKITNSKCKCVHSKEFCANCNWDELSTATLSTPESVTHQAPEIQGSYSSFIKDKSGNYFSLEESNKLFWLRNSEMMDLMANNELLNYKGGAGDGPEVNLVSNNLQQMKTVEAYGSDLGEIVEEGAGEGIHCGNHSPEGIVQGKKDESNMKLKKKESSTYSISERKTSKLFAKLKKSQSQQMSSFLANNFSHQVHVNGQHNKKSKMCVIL
ncbi:X-linked retinitis pigmentosa GTPase regulator-like isoform X2 [Cimex lectularius]|uniref:RCC1-like domain-containing protein n=1 Tax=Cimex lectularius TaxID=79782 RepID=A0A8I6THH0_CIMLE|nr:X-linked retinitis pigmentosa GTPase regulator-like isoform X2 [Cimex lectularius]